MIPVVVTVGVLGAFVLVTVAMSARDDRDHTEVVVRSVVPPTPERASLSSNLDAFRGLPAVERVPGDVADVLAFAAGEEVAEDELSGVPRPGRPLLDEMRELLDNLGSKSASFYAAPTENGWVCYVITEGIALKCIPALVDDAIWTLRYGRENGVGVLEMHGMVGNDIARLFVETASGLEEAIVRNNAFYFERRGIDVTNHGRMRLVLEYRGGVRRSIEVQSSS